MCKTNVYEEVNVTNSWVIVDEKGKYVHANSIKKISKDNYIYTSYARPERAYTSMEAVEIALFNLKLHNEKGNLGHSFEIEQINLNQPNLDYLILDTATGHYITETSVKDTEEGVKLLTYTGRTSGLGYYSTKERAEQAIHKIQSNLRLFGLHRGLEVVTNIVDNMIAGELVIYTIK